MEVQDISNSSDLKWKRIISNEGLHSKDRNYTKTLLYKNYILFFGSATAFPTQSNHILVFDLDRDEWSTMNPKGESSISHSEGFSASYFSKDKIIFYGGCSMAARKKNFDEEEEKMVLGPVRVKSVAKDYKYSEKKKSPKKERASPERGFLEMLILDDAENEDIIISTDLQSRQWPRGRWEDVGTDSKLLSIKYHTTNVFENKLYLVGGCLENGRIQNNLYIINFDSVKPSVICRDIEDSGESVFEPRQKHSSLQFHDKIYYFGGINYEGEYLNDLWAFNPYTLHWQEIEFKSLIPTPRVDCIMQLAGDTIYIMGGKNNFGPCKDLLIHKIGMSIKRLTQFKDIGTDMWERKTTGIKDLKDQELFVIYENKLIFGQDFDLYSLELRNVERSMIGGSAEDSNFRVSDHKLFMDKTYADITFNVEGQKIKAHKAIVASRSSHLRNMFQNGVKETNSDVVEVPEMKADTFNGFLEYLYCGELDFTEETAVDLLKLSDKFGANGLRTLCEKFLTTALKPKNALSLTNLADVCGARKLKEAGLIYMATNFDEVFDNQDIRNLPSSLIMELFKYKAK